jgi:DNA-binding transcriptional regulator YiaG
VFKDGVRAERARLGLSQQGLSDALGIPKRTIEDWEGGRRTPPPWVEKLLFEKLKQMEKGGNRVG